MSVFCFPMFSVNNYRRGVYMCVFYNTVNTKSVFTPKH